MRNSQSHLWRFRLTLFHLTGATILSMAAALIADSTASQIGNADVSAVKDIYMQKMKTEFDNAIAQVTKERDALQKDTQAWRELNGELKSLQSKKQKFEKVELGITIYSSVKNAKDAMASLIEEAQKSRRGFDVNPDVLAGHRIVALDSLKALNTVQTGKDYYDKIKTLSEDLNRLKESDLSPSTRKLAQSMTVLTRLMEEFGDKTPVVGEIIKAYGQIGGGLVTKAAELDAAFADLEQGQLIKDGVGNRGIRATMAKKVPYCDKDTTVVAWAVPGVPRVYRNTCTVLIWDSGKENWHNAKEAYPNHTPDALTEMILSRYTTYLEYELSKPTPYQLLNGFEKAVVLTATTSKRGVQSGETIELTASGKWLKDLQPVSRRLKVKFRNKRKFLLKSTGGEFSSDGDGLLNSKIGWTAPNATEGMFYQEVDLNEEDYFAVRPAETSVVMGLPGRIQLRMNRESPFTVGSSVRLEALLVDDTGTPYLKKDAGGWFTISCDECEQKGGSMLAFAANATHSGMMERWKMPDEPGEYLFQVSYEPGHFVKQPIAADALTEKVTVVPPKFSLTVEPEIAPADEKQDAAYEWIVKNDDVIPVNLRFRRQFLRDQKNYWALGELPATMTLEPGETQRISFSMKITDVENARIQKVKWIASPELAVADEADKWSRFAVVEARNDAFQGDLVPAVDGVAYQFGQGLPNAVSGRQDARDIIAMRLSRLENINSDLTRSLAASGAEVSTFISFYRDKLKSNPTSSHAATYSYFGEKWYPGWQQILADFHATGISVGMINGNRALSKMGNVTAPDIEGSGQVTWQNGLSYYVQLNQRYYMNLEKRILTQLKRLIEKYGDTAMPKEDHARYVAEYNRRKARSNGDVGPLGDAGDWLPFEEAIYKLLSTEEMPKEEETDSDTQPVFSLSTFAGTWKGTMVPVGEAARLAKRHGGFKEEPATIIIYEKDGKLYADLSRMQDDDDGLFVPYKNEPLSVSGRRFVWEKGGSHTIQGFTKSKTYHWKQGFAGELQGEGNILFGFVRIILLDFDIQFKMVLTKSGSGAVADTSVKDLEYDPMGLENEAAKDDSTTTEFVAIPGDDGIFRMDPPKPLSIFKL
ncbi:MAG: hypothetical protein JXR76_09075 [Deltaproteobacteria bacterium]|nr:hypothetical protein [Deltaproteobacteria bacterium]